MTLFTITRSWVTHALYIFMFSDLCTCSAYGDPHYRQFDKKYYTFNGFCKYTMTKYIDPHGNCSFNIEVKNERRGSRRRISYTRLIDVHMYGITIRLHKNKQVFVSITFNCNNKNIDDEFHFFLHC